MSRLVGPVVRVEPSRPTLVVATEAPRADLVPTMLGCFDQVYAALDAGGVPKSARGQNIVLYLDDRDGRLTIEAGIELNADVTFPDGPAGSLVRSSLPAGRVARIEHWGDYSQLSQAYETLHHWSHAENQPLSGPSWEVYGDWSDDPDQLLTEVFHLLA